MNIFYGWVGVGGSIFCMCGGGKTYFMDEWGCVGVDGGIFKVGRGG